MPQSQVTHKFTTLSGERVDDGHYRLAGLPEGADFRSEESYKTIETGWLKVEGVGFAAPTFEFSEHQTYVVVEQDRGGGPAHISFEEM